MGVDKSIARQSYFSIFQFLSLGLLLACSGPEFETSTAKMNALTPGPEPQNCTPVAPVSNPIAIQGSGQFYYRATHETLGLYGDPVAADIRRAEIAIKNSAGTVIQCGSTDNNGAFSLQIPKTAGTYTLSIYSRSPANSSHVNASVLEDIYASTPYSVSKSFTISSGSISVNLGTLSAYARQSDSEKIEGAAFFIFDVLLRVNERMRAISGDAGFLAPKVQAYWKAGFNPYSYFGSPDSLVSFYINGERKLYILGGSNGNVKSMDTDHFDPSVIVHEYGHFLEDVYGRSESPGGSHNGNNIIDPRLAWSEGWANYYQSEMLNGHYFSKNLYIDTMGFKNDSVEGGSAAAGIGIKFELNVDGGGALYDPVAVSGEGTFREISISRTLYKTTRSPASSSVDSKGAAIPFEALWNTFKTSFGSNSGIVYRSIGYFNEFLYSYIGTNYSTGSRDTWITNVLSDEKQNYSRVDYGDILTPAASCAKFPRELSPVQDADYGGAYRSNLLRSNDFYSFYSDGSTQTITLSYTQGGLYNIDLDLILWNQNYRYLEDEQEFFQGYTNNYYITRSRRANPSVETGTESITVSGLSPGYYLLNVKAVTFNRNTGVRIPSFQLNGTAEYNLQITTGSTTEYLCPAH